MVSCSPYFSACLPPTGWCCGCSDVSTRPLRSVSCSSFPPRSRPNPQGPWSEGRAAPVPERAEAQCRGPDPSPPGFGSHLPVGTLQIMGSELPLRLQADGGRKLRDPACSSGVRATYLS
ncbi:unnamed protein product [Rangifer tarandus platyrhynchus]|uniref:Uncharacterized protein n=1 Tax=Rangifer tarandus platyrhynchus TaxID=3082113 RepID=A0AC59ZCH6_RANTA